ncbi:MAG TPA: hypothetical protein VJG49_00540 [Candidatus Nanoarchaeia archaeon]|nr:hypothetical protein [Candidatus Nanoarchaeia archaeon]
MSKKEFIDFLMRNKKEADRAMKEFEKHSREFDKQVSKILSGL